MESPSYIGLGEDSVDEEVSEVDSGDGVFTDSVSVHGNSEVVTSSKVRLDVMEILSTAFDENGTDIELEGVDISSVAEAVVASVDIDVVDTDIELEADIGVTEGVATTDEAVGVRASDVLVATNA